MIRLATPADRPTVEAIVAAAYGGYIERIGRPPAPMLDDYEALIAAGRVHLLDAEGVIRGLVVLVPEAEAMLLDNVAVDPSIKGRGFGRRLLTFAEEQAMAAGYRRIRLYTHALMTENIALYTRIGYREDQRAEVDGRPRVFLSKPLPPSP